ncbi:MAG TPA: choice-of-anchor P family protein [Ktedonobacteraceae bacterium]|nr:choice-of-anchor P family protein [Ktedonobacteraceae bacterium]
MKRTTISVATVLVTLLTLSYIFSFALTDAVKADSTIINSAHGYAFAGYAAIPAGSSNVAYGPIAELWFGCSNRVTQLNSGVANLSLGSYANTGNAQTSITTSQAATSATVQTVASLQNVNVLSGLITAKQLQVEVASTITATDATSAVENASFSGLTIAGKAFNTTPGPNTTVQIANLGYVVLNETGLTSGANYTYAGSNMIDLHVAVVNSQGLPIGARIIIGQVNSSQQRLAQPTVVDAHSYGVDATAQSGSNSVSTTPAAPANLSCTGGYAQNGAASTSSQQVGSVGTINDTVSGQINSSGTTVTGASNVANPNLLGGLVKGSQVTATANASWNNTGSGSASTDLTNMTIDGIPASKSPAANTRVSLLGLGYVILNEQTSSVNSSGATETVNAIDIYITQTNLFGIQIGTQIILGHATASAFSLR